MKEQEQPTFEPQDFLPKFEDREIMYVISGEKLLSSIVVEATLRDIPIESFVKSGINLILYSESLNDSECITIRYGVGLERKIHFMDERYTPTESHKNSEYATGITLDSVLSDKFMDIGNKYQIEVKEVLTRGMNMTIDVSREEKNGGVLMHYGQNNPEVLNWL